MDNDLKDVLHVVRENLAETIRLTHYIEKMNLELQDHIKEDKAFNDRINKYAILGLTAIVALAGSKGMDIIHMLM